MEGNTYSFQHVADGMYPRHLQLVLFYFRILSRFYTNRSCHYRNKELPGHSQHLPNLRKFELLDRKLYHWDRGIENLEPKDIIMLVMCLERHASFVSYANSSHFNTNVEHLTLSLGICVISSKNFVSTSKACLRHIMQTVARIWFRKQGRANGS